MVPRKTFQKLAPEKQDRITTEAIDEFSRQGYQGASINALVGRLGIAKGSIFQYFGDKQGLFRFVFDVSVGMVKDYLKDVRRRTETEDLFSRLQETLEAGVRFVRDHPRIYSLYLRVMYEPSMPLRDEILASLRAYSTGYLQSLLKTARERGELSRTLAMDEACFLLDAVMDRFLQALTVSHLDSGMGLYKADTAAIERRVAGLMEILRYGIGSERGPQNG